MVYYSILPISISLFLSPPFLVVGYETRYCMVYPPSFPLSLYLYRLLSSELDLVGRVIVVVVVFVWDEELSPRKYLDSVRGENALYCRRRDRDRSRDSTERDRYRDREIEIDIDRDRDGDGDELTKHTTHKREFSRKFTLEIRSHFYLQFLERFLEENFSHLLEI